MEPELQPTHDNAYSVKRHPLSSPNRSTAVVLTGVFAVLNQLSRMVPYGDLVISGVDPSALEPRVYAWLDGVARRIGDRQLAAALLGAMRRAVETLEKELESPKEGL